MAEETAKLQFEEDLIDKVRDKPNLYDKSNADYKNKLVNENTWAAIGKELRHTGKNVLIINILNYVISYLENILLINFN